MCPIVSSALNQSAFLSYAVLNIFTVHKMMISNYLFLVGEEPDALLLPFSLVVFMVGIVTFLSFSI